MLQVLGKELAGDLEERGPKSMYFGLQVLSTMGNPRSMEPINQATKRTGPQTLDPGPGPWDLGTWGPRTRGLWTQGLGTCDPDFGTQARGSGPGLPVLSTMGNPWSIEPIRRIQYKNNVWRFMAAHFPQWGSNWEQLGSSWTNRISIDVLVLEYFE